MTTLNQRVRLQSRTTATLAGAMVFLFLPLIQYSARGQTAGPDPVTTSPKPSKPEPFSKRILQAGLSLDLQIDSQATHRAGEFREGDDVGFSLKIRDSATGNALSGLNPAAWMTLVRKGESSGSKGCLERAQTLLGGGLLARPELDLNVYHVLALNADPTITVVDPLFGYGSSKLLALIPLKSPGDDWVVTSDQETLFVSMPESNQVAVIDTSSWSVTTNVKVGSRPSRLALQPDEAYLWVSCEASGQPEITAVSLRELKPVARFAIGNGRRQIAFSDDSRYAFVTNPDASSVSVIDVRKLVKTRDVPIGSAPSSIAFSKLAQAAYVTSENGGTITAISSPGHEVIARIKAEPGLGQIKFAPGDRLGFVVNTVTNSVYIIDAAVNRIIQKADAEKAPDQLAFSSKLAYVRQRDSEIVLMIPLSEVGKEGKPVSVVDFPGGQNPLGKTSRTSIADAIVAAGDDNAVLVANPGDKTIYYYQEGMAAPMGNFSNYGREPRAVMIVDRSLRETRPGTYSSIVRLPQAGQYRIVMFVNNPRVVECIDFTIARNPNRAEVKRPLIQQVSTPTATEPGKQITLSFRLSDPVTGKPIIGLKDLIALTFAVGVWQDRRLAVHLGDGVYSLAVVPPHSAIYSVYLSSASIGLVHMRVSTFEAKDVK